MITSRNWNDKLCVLRTEDGEPVNKGDQFPDFRGDVDMIMSGRAPHKSSSSGFVYRASGMQSYPGVYGLKWVEVEE